MSASDSENSLLVLKGIRDQSMYVWMDGRKHQESVAPCVDSVWYHKRSLLIHNIDIIVDDLVKAFLQSFVEVFGAKSGLYFWLLVTRRQAGEKWSD